MGLESYLEDQEPAEPSDRQLELLSPTPIGVNDKNPLIEDVAELVRVYGAWPKGMGPEHVIKREPSKIPEVITELAVKSNARTYTKQIIRNATRKPLATAVVLGLPNDEAVLSFTVIADNGPVNYLEGEVIALTRALSNTPHKFRHHYATPSGIYEACRDLQDIIAELKSATRNWQVQQTITGMLVALTNSGGL